MYAGPVERLITEFSKLPGIGPRTAQRLTFHLLRLQPNEVLPLAAAITEVKEKIGFCTRCFNLAEGELCTICVDPRRDPAVLCVVEQPFDVVTIERTREFRGYYHVLGGALSPIDGVDPEDLHLTELLDARGRRRERSDRGYQPDHDGRGDGDVHRRPAAGARARHAPRQRPAGGRRPRIR